MPSRGKLEPRSSMAALAGAEPFAAVVEAPAPASLVLVAGLSLVDAGTRLAPRRERVRLIAARWRPLECGYPNLKTAVVGWAARNTENHSSRW